MQYGKKICALLLVLCMLVGVVPAGALADEASASTAVVGQQLSLGDDLTMQFYVSVESQYIESAVMNITAGGSNKDYEISGMTANDDGNYEFSVSLGAPEMTEDITLTLTSGDTKLLEKVYSVQDYAHYLLENNYTDETKALAKEMLNYGAKAQLYFGHKTDDLADAGYEIDNDAQIDAEAPAVTASGSISGITFYGTSMVFRSKVAIRYYFTAPDGVDGCTFTVDGNEVAPVLKGDKYYIEVADINPDQMDTEMTVKATKGEEEISVTYSPMYYITRMYNKETTSAEMKALLLAAKGYFDAAKVFTGVAENRTGSLNLAYRYGANNLIQVNTNIPADTPCANFTASDNGCSIDQSANQYQQFGWVGMDNVDGTIVLTFHFNAAFEAGQTYTLPKGAVFGFTDNSKYTLDKNYTFTFDGSSWTMEAKEPSISLTYRYGANNLIQFNTDLPSDTPCVNFTASDNGCSIDQSANQYQQVGWIGMDNVDGTIVLTFNFNDAFTFGQSYTLSAGSVFGFTNGNVYELANDVTLYWNDSEWVAEKPMKDLNLTYRWGAANTIQFNTDLPDTTALKDFLATDNGCSIIQSGDQQVGYVSMLNADGTIVLTFNFNGAFTFGQSYTLSAGSVFGFTDGVQYKLASDVTLYWNDSEWVAEKPMKDINLTYRWGNANLIQFNTDLPDTTALKDFLATDNGCSIIQSGDQQVGYVSMLNADGTIVLTFNFNGSFTFGQSYTLSAGSVFGFTDGTQYKLASDVTLYWNGSDWSKDAPAVELPALSFEYRYGTSTLIQVNTNLPSTTPIANFLTSDNGCEIDESANAYKNVAWIGMTDADGTIVLTFNFGSAFEAGQNYVLPVGAIFGFTDGNKYALDKEYNFVFDGTSWAIEGEEPEEPETAEVNLTYRWGNANTIQFNTNLPATTTLKDFLASDNGCSITQGGDQQVGYISMLNDNGTIVLTLNFNADFAAGQSYTLAAGSVFAFTDGTSYVLDADYSFYWDGSAWGTEPLITLSYRYGAANLIQFNTNLPATTPLANFTAGENGCDLKQDANTVQQVGWIGMADAEGTIVLTFNFNADFTDGQSYILSAGSVFGFTDGSSYVLPADVQLYWNGESWSAEEPAPEVDVLDESNFNSDEDIITFADLPVDGNDATKLQEYKELGFNTSLLTEDHTGAQGPDERYSVSMQTANAPSDSLNFQYRYGANNLIQVNTNLPSDTPCVNFTASDNGCDIDQSGNTVQQVGWIGMDNVDGTIVLSFHFNTAFEAGQTYVLPKDALFCFTDDSMYLLDADYTFTFDGTNWSVDASTLNLSLSAGAAKYIQLKTNIPTGLSYGDFLLGDTSKGNLILETTDGAQAVAWFSYSELSGAVYLTFNFNGYNKPGTQYILKSGTTLKAGDNVYTTDRDYILTVHNDYLTSLENLDNAGLNVWIRNYHNTADYFTSDLTAALLLYKDQIDGFYMVDEAFQTNALLTAAGQTGYTSDFESMVAVRDWFNSNFADKYYHSNNVPMSSWDHYTATDGSTLSAIDIEGYRNFLQTYKTTFNDQLSSASGTSVSFDNYPFVHDQGTYGGFFGIGGTFESGIQDTYLLNCLIAAQVAGEDDFGLCIQTFEATDLKNNTSRDITSAAEVSLQLYTGMAMGADLFEYFAYNSNDDFNAIMNTDGTKRLYDIVKEGNEALCFDNLVNAFTWNGIMTVAGSTNNHNGDAFDSVADLVLTDATNGVLNTVSSTDDAIVGCFTKDTLNGYMLVNYNDPAAVTGNNTVTVSFADCTRARVYTNVDGVLTSELVELTDGAYTATLAPGSACFIIPA